MQATEIDILAAEHPGVADKSGITAAQAARAMRGASSAGEKMDPAEEHMNLRAAARFAARYTNMAFGWSIATAFAKHRQRFPIPLYGKDTWVFRAWLMRMDPVKFYDPDIANAMCLAHMAIGSDIGATMQALMLSCLGSEERNVFPMLERATGISEATWRAYEALFYNVMDRNNDHIYLASNVYPHTRFVEMSENYLQREPLAKLLQRAGYNNRDAGMTAYMAGIGDNAFMVGLANRADRESHLEKHLVGNGIVLALTGAMNTKAVGISRVTTLLAASRQGGQKTEDNPFGGLGNMLMTSWAGFKNKAAAVAARIMEEDEGELGETGAHLTLDV